MPRPRSSEFVSVINAVESLRPDFSGKVFTLDDLRSSLSGRVSTFGAGDNFLRRAVQECMIRGEVRQSAPGTYRFVVGNVEESESPMESEVSEVEDFDAMYTPGIDPSFIMPTVLSEYLPAIQRRLEKGDHQKFRVTGPAGCGKTEGGVQVAARLGLDVLIVDCSIIREPRDFFGSRTVRDGRVVWVDSQFSRAIAKGNCMIILDEVNRCSELVGNALLPLLDSRKATLIEERGAVLRCGPGIVFWATANEGSEYTGTGAMDRAVRDRFQRTVEFTYLPSASEIELLHNRTGISKEIAGHLVEVANRTRRDAGGMSGLSQAISTRQLIAAAEDIVDVGTHSLQYTITNTFSSMGGAESERNTVANLLVGRFTA